MEFDKNKKMWRSIAMKEVFIGTPTKQEIDMYLGGKDYSLPRMSELREEILSAGNKGDTCGSEHFFREIFPDTKTGGALQEKTNRFLKFTYIKRPTKCAAQRPVPDTGATKLGTRALKRLTYRNTQKNTGYKNVKLYYRSRKRVFFGGFAENSREMDVRECKIRWDQASLIAPQSIDKVTPILKCETTRFGGCDEVCRKKTHIFIETVSRIPDFLGEADFQYKVNK